MSAAPAPAFGRAAREALRWLDWFERGGYPWFALAVRLLLAQSFFVSGLLKLADWDKALFLATNEYPLAWLEPASAALLGVSIELIGSLLLALGLAARGAAAALLVLVLVAQFNYRELDTHLLQAALCGWLAVFGAGRLSLDHAVARGLAASALPLGNALVRGAAALTSRGGPLYAFALRLWLAAALALSAEAAPKALHAWVPLAGETPLSAAVLLLTLALAFGAGTRLVALLVIVTGLAGALAPPASAEPVLWLFGFGLLLLRGPGPWAFDALLDRAARNAVVAHEARVTSGAHAWPRVVIVGAGFGGLSCAVRLARLPVQVTLIDRQNYHLFQPLLYQVATAALSPGDIAIPVRSVFREHRNTTVLMATVTGVDTKSQAVLLGERRLPYDYLVLGTGATHSYFGRDEWGEHAPGLKRVEDALAMRGRLLSAFERAENTDDDEERQRLLTFVIVGGGPTGVELAGAIAELARYGMEREFRRFDPGTAQVILVQAAPRLLPAFPKGMSAVAQESLERIGVRVLTGSRVERIDARGVTIGGEMLPAGTVLWAAGVTASPAAHWLGAKADAAGRVEVGSDLSVPGLPNVFVVGDTAAVNAWAGRPVPGLAPAAKQAGVYVARVIATRATGRTAPKPFVYRHLGSLATIGRQAAVADFGALRFSGAPAWWIWGLVHIGFLVGLRNRISVLWDWFWAYLTQRSGTRLITGDRNSQ